MERRRTYTPLILGILFVALAIFGEEIANAFGGLSLEENILLNVAIRGLAVFLAFTYCERFQLKKTWWILFALLFGGWTLIVLNFAIWVQGREKEISDENETQNLEDSSNKE